MNRKPFSRNRWRRGFTYVEVMISIGISSLVFTAVAYLQLYSARSAKEVYGQTRTRSTRMIALDAIRYRLMNARVGSAQTMLEGRRIEFVDPTRGNITSAFFFNGTQRQLYYDQNINDGAAAEVVASGPINVSFQVLNAGETIQLNVRSASEMAYGDVDIQDGQTTIYLRNPYSS